MFKQAKPARDAFTFSLGGMSAIAWIVAPPIVADDRINKVRQDQDRGQCLRAGGYRHTALASCS